MPDTHPLSNTHTPTMIAMSEHAWLRVSGRDARKFLQGQLTCDLNRFDQQHFLLGGHCSHQGRMLSSFILALAHDDSVVLRVRHNIANSAMTALKKYLVFAKADIILTELKGLTLLLEDSSLSSLCDADGKPMALPPVGHFTSTPTLTILRHQANWLEVWAEATTLQALQEQLAPNVQQGSPNQLEALLIQQGWVEIQSALEDKYLPQQLNYQWLDGISFKKGCYTGQEIVARLHYRGQVKTQLYHAKVTSHPELDIALGSQVLSDTQAPLGDIVARVKLADGDELLMVGNNTLAEHSNWRLADSLLQISWVKPAYAIPSESNPL